MNAELNQVRDQQRYSWNEFSPGYKRWDDLMMDFLTPLNNEMITSLSLKDTDTVLDIAAGTGEPGLSIARIVKNGKVIVTDLAERMLDIAKDKAAKMGIKNLDAAVCDVCEMPFADESFDAVSCRLGFMFFPDMALAAGEMARVLKPGSRVSAAVWGAPDKNPHIISMMGMVAKNIPMSPPPPGSPGIFRCAPPGTLTRLYADAGLKNISEREVTGQLNFDSNETYWDFMNDIAAPGLMAFKKADDELKQKVKNEVFDMIGKYWNNDKLQFNYTTIIVSGEK